MSVYKAPLNDIEAVLNALTALYPNWAQDIDTETRSAILKEAARLAEDTLTPSNRIGDTQGVHLDANNTVITPQVFKEAYRLFCESGWMGAGSPETYGGLPLPMPILVALHEIWNSANAAFAMLPMLNYGVIDTLCRLGSEQLKTRYLPALINGTIGSAMVLTESEAGSDFSALTTRATPAPDTGDDTAYLLHGQKIFITYGDHDLTENIIHLALARTAHASGSLRGLSLFLVPKYLEDGSKNAWRCTAVEHKMGIRGCPTTALSYDGAIGYRLGKPGRGLEYFYGMMRLARFFIGVQGLSLSQCAYQAALSYAHTRIQGRILGCAHNVPIITHPDVRRMLADMMCRIHAMRAMIYDTASQMTPDDDSSEFQSAYIDLMIPLIKAWCTDQAVHITSAAIQVYGGIGYVEDAGIAQYFRDARIGPIYEGTNGIQAIDVLIRRTIRDKGEWMRTLIDQIQQDADNRTQFSPQVCAWLQTTASSLTASVNWIVAHAHNHPNAVLLIAVDYCALLGWAIGGWRLIQQTEAHAPDTIRQHILTCYLHESSRHIQESTTAITTASERWLSIQSTLPVDTDTLPSA